MTLDELERLLGSMSAGELLAGPHPERRLRELRSHCHPDRFAGTVDEKRAEALFVRVGRLPEEAAVRPPDPIVVKSPKRTYRLTTRLAVGDVADVWEATVAGTDYLVKVSRTAEGPAALRRESDVLTRLHTRAGDQRIRLYLPLPCESFDVVDRGTRRVNVTRHDPLLFTAEDVRARHAALDGRHIGWLFNRLLTLMGFIHGSSIIHGAILPCHLLVRPSDHGIVLIGWGQSVDAGQPVSRGVSRYSRWYPVEAANRLPAHARFDLFMAAKTMLWLAGYDVEGEPVLNNGRLPGPMWRFLTSCCIRNPGHRPQQASDLQKEWEGLLADQYGPKKFVELTM